MPSAQQAVNVKQGETLQHPAKDTSLPRNSTTTGNKTPQEYPEFIKQALLTIEKKVRNLEKRRTKLDEYKELQKKGQTLNEDQLSAVSKYEEVKTCLELVKELDKQLVGFANDALKAQKKQSKKEQQEREELVKDKLKEVQKLQFVLSNFNDEKVKNDFLEGKRGVNPLTKDEVELLNEFSRLALNTQLPKLQDSDLNEVVDHYLSLIEGKNKPVLKTTYAELKKLFDKILSSNYWSDQSSQQSQQEQPQQQQNEEHEQKLTNVNTSTDDYVMVSRHEVEITQIEREENINHEVALKVQQTKVVSEESQVGNEQVILEQHTDQNTFFTTLNRPDNNLIKEFLAENNEGINFLQDSQIYPQQEQQDQPSDDYQHEHHQTDFGTNVYNNQRSENLENENANPNSNNYGFGKRNDNGFGQRNNGGQNYRRPFNPDNNDRRNQGRGGFSRGGGRGGFNRGPGNSNNRGGFRGKPRNPGQSFNRNNQQMQPQASE